MRIPGALAGATSLEVIPTDPCTPRAAPDATTARPQAGGDLLASLGAPAFDPRRAGGERGIIVIGGSQGDAAATDAGAAMRQGPLLQGIIIVGGSPSRDPNSDPSPELVNVQIQQVLAALTQAESVAAHVEKKADDTTADIIRNIG